ncbi:hypothetical protein [Halobaculum litoreum]|uniref:Uncharacterized protein n=1 Tax=Halobaculum litoreum TaxID=3031998 RepID=A0ABD5XLD8_9EURY
MRDLAAALDRPASTVSYRLRQAESRLAKGYLGRFGSERAVGGPAD